MVLKWSIKSSNSINNLKFKYQNNHLIKNTKLIVHSTLNYSTVNKQPMNMLWLLNKQL